MLSLAVAPNLHVVKERLGHQDIRMTVSTYGHLLPSIDAALPDGLAQVFDGAALEQAANGPSSEQRKGPAYGASRR